MNDNTSIIIPDASALQVDTSCIDVSEVKVQEDKEFLLQKGENILRIVARAALEVGRELVEIQEKFRTPDNPNGEGLVKFYGSIGISPKQAQNWSNKYRAFCSYVELFGEEGASEKLNGLGDEAATRMWNLPRDYREAFLADIAIGETPSHEKVVGFAKRPEVKLTKAQELLEAAKLRKEEGIEQWELVKANPDLDSKSPEYVSAKVKTQNAVKHINQYEQRIAELQQQIEDERQAKEAEAEKVNRVRSELEKLKFDDDQTRQERIKRLTNSLTISVPQVMADLQKFFTEADSYPEDVRAHLLEQTTYLANYIGDNL